jgi:hypothetical protein
MKVQMIICAISKQVSYFSNVSNSCLRISVQNFEAAFRDT